MEINICEFFGSIQGEGCLQGLPSVFIRLSGCNLSCKWCDTQSVLKANDINKFTEHELLQQLQKYKCKNIVITGGEPTLYPDLNNLIQFLKSEGYHITVETNATILREMDGDLISMSPKLSHSNPVDTQAYDQHNQKRINLEAINHYIKNNNYQLKFVARNCKEDFEEIKNILSQLDEYDLKKVLIMPLSTTRKELYEVQQPIVELCIQYNFRYANRLQLQIWDEENER